MVLYKCNKCLKEFNKKSNYKTHINRKTPCNRKTSFESCVSNVPKLEHDSNKHMCQFCNKSYSRKPNLNRHLKTCKIKIDKEFKKNTFDMLLNKINDLNIIVENQNNIIKDLQDKIEGNVKVNDVKDIIKSLKKDIKLNRTEIIHFKYKT
jgi:hypothetical protein